MIDILTILFFVFLHFVFNSILLIEYKNDFEFIKKKWGVMFILLFGWVFLSVLLITLFIGMCFAALYESSSLLFKRGDDV